jgi:uncharacterized Zn finger protein
VSSWDRNWYPPAKKQPPPERGIKIDKTGTTWWGKRWIGALERMSAGYSSRLARGKTYARAGRVHDLVAGPGGVTALVTGTRPAPYAVRIALGKLPDTTWTKAIEAMAKKAQFAAELLGGQMPAAIDEAFAAAGAALFPGVEADLTTECSCPDWVNPCKHVAATHYVLAEALDRDPFLLFELRGRTKERVLETLRASRGGTAQRGRSPRARERAADTGVSLGKLTHANYDSAAEPLPALQLSVEPAPASGALLQQLGVPAGWSDPTPPAELLAPLVRAAAQRALAIATAEPESASEPAPPRPRHRARRKRKTRK